MNVARKMEVLVKVPVGRWIALLLAGLWSIAVVAATGAAEQGRFINLKGKDGREVRAFVAGPAEAKAGVLIVHDYLGITDATREAVSRLGSMGYLAVAVDLYGGKSANNHEDAVKLMEGVDNTAAAAAVKAGLDFLKRPGRKVATVGFSMGGQHALRGNLNDAGAVSATVIVYGFGFDKIETAELEKLQSPVLVVSGALDAGATDAAVHFLANMKVAKRDCELFIYPGADHGYAQPLFMGGKNYSPEAVRATWVVVDDFLAKHLKRQ